ncbi:molybdopterin-dependent oxidoreductase [Salarchaeum japonicum]|uniref:Sulfite oxidase n=1 Tax=Salarchaeum japonicum TaxID=555573 RepID=A0AAV3T3B9_9EURY|nr:molybdopterin-dependent oxidoreductase [Salarchaeum japonicum]
MGVVARAARACRARATSLGLAGLAGVAALASSYAVAGRTPRFVAAPVASAFVDAAPAALVRVGIESLGSAAQSLVLLSALAAAVALYAVPVLCALLAADHARLPAEPLVAAGALAVGWGLVGAPGSAVAAAAGATLIVAASRLRAPKPGGVDTDRRSVLAGALSAAGLSFGGWLVGSADSGTGGPGERAASTGTEGRLLDRALAASFDVDGLEPLVSTEFYEVDINAVNPTPNREGWTLDVTGAVESERTHDLAGVRSFPTEHRFVTLRCVSDPLNGTKLDTALWTGVPVRELLDDAGVTEDACCVVLRAKDGFYMEVPLEAVEDGLLAVGMNGLPLPREHGAPARVLVPGHWGEVNVKWVTELEVTETPVEGYWEKRGWHGTGPVNTVAKLHAVTRDGGRIEVAGHAYAGTRGVERVEVSTDGGRTWADTDLTDPLPARVPADADDPALGGRAADAWRGWRFAYDAPGTEHEVVVRATDGTNAVQSREYHEPYPRGATGWVSRTID